MATRTRRLSVHRGICHRTPVRAPAVRISVTTVRVLLQVAWVVVRSGLVASVGEPLVLTAIAFSFLAGAIALALPGARIAALDRALQRLATDRRGADGLAVAAGLALGLAGATTQQMPSWDEQWMLPAVRLVADEGLRTFFERYASLPWLGQQHPPLPVLFYASVMRAFDTGLLGLRIATVLIGTVTLLVALRIARRLVDPVTALLSVLALLASPLFVRMESAAMNDMFVTAFFAGALAFTLRLSDAGAGSTLEALGLGLCVGAGMVSKYTMALACPVLAVCAWNHGALWRRRREWAIAVAVAGLVFGAWLLLAARIGAIGGQGAWLERYAGTVTDSGEGLRYALDGLFTKLPSGLGVWQMPWLVLGAASLARESVRSARLISVWVALVCAPLLLTLPDNRYVLPAYPAFAILIACGLQRIGTERTRALVLAWLLCGVTLGYYAQVDLGEHAFLFEAIHQRD